jgi:ribose transport system substrate-binding protein
MFIETKGRTRTMIKRRYGAILALALAGGVAVLTAAATSSARTHAVPSWCGPKKISLGLTDGFGGNSWRLVTTASARNEAAKCPSVTSLSYADGQGNTQKAISDIQGMVAKGINAIVVFPDAGKAILPALTSSYKAGVVTVPYRVTPGGKAGVNFNVFVDTPFAQAGENWGKWILQVLPKGGNVLMLSGPQGNSQGVEENQGLHKILDPTHKYKFIGAQPFEVTNWDHPGARDL